MKKDRQLVILLAALLVLIFLSSCAAGKNTSMTPAATDFAYAEDYSYTRDAPAEEPQAEAPMANEYKAEIGGAMGEMSFDDTAEDASTEDYSEEVSVSDFTEKIIYSAYVSIETTDFDASVSGLEQKIRSLGGFVENSNVSGDTRWNKDGTTSVVNRWAYYTFRIPAEKFEYFLQLTHTYGNVLSTSRSAQNVTSSYTDFEARLSSLNTQEERLLDMLSKSTDVETLIALEQRLSDVRYEIEAIERNLRNYDAQIRYSTIDLSIREVDLYTPTVPIRRSFGEKLEIALSDGWTQFMRGTQNLLLGLAASLPALILLLVLAAAVIICIRIWVKKRKAKKAAAEAAAKEQEP